MWRMQRWKSFTVWVWVWVTVWVGTKAWRSIAAAWQGFKLTWSHCSKRKRRTFMNIIISYQFTLSAKTWYKAVLVVSWTFELLMENDQNKFRVHSMSLNINSISLNTNIKIQKSHNHHGSKEGFTILFQSLLCHNTHHHHHEVLGMISHTAHYIHCSTWGWTPPCSTDYWTSGPEDHRQFRSAANPAPSYWSWGPPRYVCSAPCSSPCRLMTAHQKTAPISTGL